MTLFPEQHFPVKQIHGHMQLIGGATPIANSAAVFERVLAEIPELVEGVRQRGLGMKMVFRAPGSEGKHNGFNWAGEYSFGQEF